MIRDQLVTAFDAARLALRIGRARDPRTGRLCGALTAREAIRAGQATVGPESYGNPTMHFGPGESTRVDIGAYCSFAVGAEFLVGGGHRTDWISTHPFRVRWGLPGAYEDGHPAPAGDIVVGNDVWVGMSASILSGVQIGDGAVIGARAVVAKDVRPYAVVVGNPAREVRRRFSDEQVEALLRIGWWSWPADRTREAVGALSGPDVDAFIAAHDPAGAAQAAGDTTLGRHT